MKLNKVKVYLVVNSGDEDDTELKRFPDIDLAALSLHVCTNVMFC